MWSEWAMLVIIPGIGSRSQAMNAGGQDISQTLEFRTATAMARLLPTGLLLIFLGLSIFVLSDADIKRIGTLVVVAVCLVAGSAVVVVALWRRINHGKPLFTLSPEGIHYRIPWVKAFNIPWSEIQAVDTVDIETGYWSILDRRTLISIPDYYEVTYCNVTVVLVSKQFYDARMSVASFWLRGPVWKAVFLPRGELVQVALHHEHVSVAPRLLREAVEARWLAFRDQPARTSVPGAGVMKLEAEQQELRRQLDEDMRRVFGR
jgi:hypothetical protein